MDMDPQVQSRTPAARAVLEAAGQLFYEQGINSVGVDAIAVKAGVTKKTLYDQFKSKSALVVAYLSARDRHYRSWIEHEIKRRSGTTRILKVFDALDSWMDAYSTKGCAFVHAHSELLGSPEHPAHEVIRAEKRWLLQLFDDLARDAGHPQPAPLATQLLSLLEGATVLRSISEMPDAVVESRHAAAVLMNAERQDTASQ